MRDDDWYKPHRPPRRKPASCCSSSTSLRHRFYRVELRDHGPYGVEAQFLDPVEVRIARTFSPHLDLTRTGARPSRQARLAAWLSRLDQSRRLGKWRA
jgi:hypothetical protein